RTPEPGPLQTERIIRLAIKVHRTLGPGQAVYNQCLCYELHQDGLAFEREIPLPIIYETMRIEKGYTAV
ncbi:MAG: hypothetical protein QOF70_4716, partial [Acetobacteraceae bacterium]|nr:hypothetical protein [Acetobacteraceae bacterium]